MNAMHTLVFLILLPLNLEFYKGAARESAQTVVADAVMVTMHRHILCRLR
jgi:hypothetical protein